MPTLEFKGKNFVRSHHHSVPFRELRPHDDVSKSRPPEGKAPSLEDNLIIHGDNLHALKALLPNYAGKVKCIYIDPPYNTGNEGWCYNDKVNSPLMREWLKKEANPVDKEDMERHDKWLCMMWPRLTLLHELLADDGVIFISIDDNEVHHLRSIMDEIFGEDNFVCELVWKKKGGASNTETRIGVITEYIALYTKKNSSSFNLRILDKGYKHKDEIGYYNLEKIIKTDKGTYNRETMKFPIANPKDNTTYMPPENYRWTIGEKTKDLLLLEDMLVFETDENNNQSVYKKKYASDNDIRGVFLNLLLEKGSLKSAKNEFESLGFGREDFDTIKPSILISHLLDMCSTPDSIILDSFAGSGTTAHAVLALNREDGGNRKFILIECEDYADSITAERVRRVIDGVATAKDPALKAGFGGSFTFTQLGEPMNIETLLTAGDAENPLPAYDTLARYIFYTATGGSLPQLANAGADFYVGESATHAIYLIYQPDKGFLRSNASALNSDRLELIMAHADGRGSKKEKLVYATAKYMGADSLKDHRITFCQLPYAIHKVIG